MTKSPIVVGNAASSRIVLGNAAQLILERANHCNVSNGIKSEFMRSNILTNPNWTQL